MDNETKIILDGLKPLFKKAIKEKLYFFGQYHQIWFSPKELKAQHKIGKFLWGDINWILRDPNERTKHLELNIIEANKELDNWKVRLRNG